MKLSNTAIYAIRGKRGMIKALADVYKISLASMYRWLDEKNPNLTRTEGIEFIEKETGLGREQILEREDEPEAVAA